MSDEFKKRVMLAKDYDPKRVKDWSKMSIEPKHDGVRVLIEVPYPTSVASGAIYYSRNGRKLEMFHHIDAEAQVLARGLHRAFGWGHCGSIMLDGEMIALTNKFGDISGAIHRKGVTELRHAVFCCFGAVSTEQFWKGGSDISQKEVRDAINQVCYKKQTHTVLHGNVFLVEDDAKVQNFYGRFRRESHEGAMVKDLSQPWTAGRSYAWMKMKAEITVDVPILDFKPGKGKYQGTMGALIVNHKGVPVPISGMDDALRRDLWRNRRKYRGKMVEVACQEITERGSLRHPRFVRLRPDKD